MAALPVVSAPMGRGVDPLGQADRSPREPLGMGSRKTTQGHRAGPPELLSWAADAIQRPTATHATRLIAAAITTGIFQL